MNSQDNDDGGGRGKSFYWKRPAERVKEALPIHHKVSLFCILCRVHWADSIFFLARSIQKWPHEVLKAATSQTNRAIFVCHCGISMGTLAVDAAPLNSVLNRE